MVKKCPNCNHYISDTVSVCPHCGYIISCEETSESKNQEEYSPEVTEKNASSEQNNEFFDSVEYDSHEQSNSKKYIIPIVIGVLLLIGIVIGIISHSTQDSPNTLVVATDSVAENVNTIVEDTVLNVSFTVIPIKSSQSTDDINTTINIDFPQSNNEYLQDVIVSFIINALTNDYTWGDNPRPNYHGDMTDGQAIADYFVKDKVCEISEERTRDSIDSEPWDENISIKRVCETDRLISYEVDFMGSHGGVGDGTTYGATFSKVDCNVIRVIANPKDSKLKSFLIKYIHSYLDSDNRDMLDEEELNKHPYPNKEPFITDKGVRMIYQKYEIGAGALGIIDITIPFSKIADYMSEDALSLIGYDNN